MAILGFIRLRHIWAILRKKDFVKNVGVYTILEVGPLGVGIEVNLTRRINPLFF